VASTIHLLPTAELAERVLLPGDPGRALLLAQSLLREPRMFNHNRGLWGYSGDAVLDGAPLTIQSTGMGGPSAAIVIAELADLGARTLVRVGTCGALDDTVSLGELLAVDHVLAQDGTSRALGAGARIAADPDLVTALTAGTDGGETHSRPRAVTIVSTDLFYDTEPGTEERWRDAGAAAVEMEAATLFALAARRGLRAGALLIATDLLVPVRQRIGEEALRAAEHRLGDVAVTALAR
jgi:uridine phosphorylase